ncbi:MAG: calcium/sodium antiporter [Nanoarchaeota archaeon]|nr:calcium/sodium antiporter [Nanoarchaeota archaeon]
MAILAIVFIISALILAKSADYFTDAAAKIGKALGAPPFIIGVTVVAIGTSLPELVSSIVAVTRGASEIVAGNIIGANIASIFFILGIVVILGRKVKIDYDIISVDLPFLLGSALLLTFAVWDKEFTWTEGALFLVGIVVYLAYTVYSEKNPKDMRIEKQIKREGQRKKKFEPQTILKLAGGGFGIYIGATSLVDSVVGLAEGLHIGTGIIAMTAVAIGTTLPELFVSIAAVRKGNPEIAIGNIIGSNIFNSLGIMGAASLFGTIIVPASVLTFGIPMLLAGTLLFIFITDDREITAWEGWLLIIFYTFFIGKTLGII